MAEKGSLANTLITVPIRADRAYVRRLKLLTATLGKKAIGDLIRDTLDERWADEMKGIDELMKARER